MVKLTKSFIDKARCPESACEMHWNDVVRGYGLRVTSTGMRAQSLRPHFPPVSFARRWRDVTCVPGRKRGAWALGFARWRWLRQSDKGRNMEAWNCFGVVPCSESLGMRFFTAATWNIRETASEQHGWLC